MRPTNPEDTPHTIQFQVSRSSLQDPQSFVYDSNIPAELTLCHLASLLHSLLETAYVNLYTHDLDAGTIQESLVFNVSTRACKKWCVLEADMCAARAVREQRAVVTNADRAPCHDCKLIIFF